ncbi:phosphonate C-P lyase system protein PhnG [Mycobacterium sp. 21AC1]|uniref:phosphonate C-P lyase system protein PhnG n=1 Tax=[Mycobacterium] appelbergii TaxID=2939269 RepID=UPI0029390238|nr:phosphonate C-P lyase system protein PhnG [Mycobacterium sp. 21AC1]MDV3129744.1 phosphonate C-P lyase system protein PhnG [Mycobacterium sp. 21AC1]
MTAELRLEALACADPDELELLADEILKSGSEVSVTAGPESVSAPIRVPVPGTEDTSVVLGHVSLTRCTVILGGSRGDGVRTGYDLAGAVAAAICDAECHRRGPLSDRVEALCHNAMQARDQRGRDRARLVATTRLEQS